MKIKDFCGKYSNTIIAVTVTLLSYLIISIRYDLYYQLNDDAMIRNILSGVYSGTPSAKCFYIMYPVGIVLAALYKIFPVLPWYEIFIHGCQMLSFSVVLTCLLKKSSSIFSKISIISAYLLFIFFCLTEHIVFATYTVTSGMLAVAAIALFVSGDKKNYIKNSIICILLVVTSYCLRNKLLVMLLPFICLAGLYKWSREKSILSFENIKKYMTVFATMILSIAAVTIVNN